MPRYTGFFIFIFVFFISIATKCSGKCFVVWYFGSETNLFLFSSVATNLISLWFLTFYIVFTKTALFISLKKSFSNLFFASFLNLVFMSMYDFKHAFWLNWITLRTLFSINPWFSTCFKILMWTSYFSLSSILQTSFSYEN